MTGFVFLLFALCFMLCDGLNDDKRCIKEEYTECDASGFGSRCPRGTITKLTTTTGCKHITLRHGSSTRKLCCYPETFESVDKRVWDCKKGTGHYDRIDQGRMAEWRCQMLGKFGYVWNGEMKTYEGHCQTYKKVPPSTWSADGDFNWYTCVPKFGDDCVDVDDPEMRGKSCDDYKGYCQSTYNSGWMAQTYCRRTCNLCDIPIHPVMPTGAGCYLFQPTGCPGQNWNKASNGWYRDPDHWRGGQNTCNACARRVETGFDDWCGVSNSLWFYKSPSGEVCSNAKGFNSISTLKSVNLALKKALRASLN